MRKTVRGVSQGRGRQPTRRASPLSGLQAFNLPPTPPDTDEDQKEILPPIGASAERDTDTTAWEPQGGNNGLDYLVPFPGDPADD